MTHTTKRHGTRPRLAAAAMGAAVLAGSALTAGSISPAQAVPGVPATAFDPYETGWYSYRDQSSSQFASTFKAKAKAGYLLTDLEIDTKGSDYRVGSVWQQNLDGRAWKEKRNLTNAQFKAEWQKAADAGMRLVEQETYKVGSTRYYAGVWVQNLEGLSWASHRGQTNAQFKASFAAHRDAGLMPVDFDEYSTSEGLRYNTVWVQKPRATSWKLYRGLTSAGFGAKFADLKSDYRVLAFESFRYGGKQRYAGIWVSNTNHRGWYFRRDLNAKAWKNYWHYYKDLGYRLVGFDRYETAAGTRYAGIWRQNSERPSWGLKSEVDSLVGTELAKGVPGVSVAVYQDGVPVYLRGFGKADIDGGVWMDADHVGSIASVSKAVAGVLTMRMQAQGDLDLGDQTRDWVPAMPEHHTHTLGNLLANRGCVIHYGEGPSSGYSNTSYATALAAADEFWDDPLVCTVGQYHYSTHGYTLLGAALEAAGGDDVKDLVRKRLTNPFGLGSLGPQNFSSSVHRMAIYSGSAGDPNEVNTPNNDWKVLGGGLDSSATDLARFGAKLIGGQILGADDLDEMWTPPAGSYAYGWSTGSEDGTPVVAKDGSWTGNLAYLRMYPEKGISVAVLMNSRAGDWSASQLGRDIGSLVLDSLE
ncbi:MAG TPA: serine hydrolase [Nocardioidaceae bacterium]|nr:serine hydrolase [Nocardioidaceae bacterium]